MVALIVVLVGLVLGWWWMARDARRRGPTILPAREAEEAMKQGWAIPLDMRGIELPPVPSLEEAFAKEDDREFLYALVSHLQDRAERAPRRMTPAAWVVHDVWTLDAEVDNGGFDQYVFNSSGDRARHVLDSLKVVGALETHAIAARAFEIAGEEATHPQRARRWAASDRWTEALRDELHQQDLAFYARKEDTGVLMIAYARPRKAAFQR